MSSIILESTSIEARAAVFAAMSDPIRLRILDTLSSDPHCVCDIQEQVGDVAPNLLSYHLKVLREAGLVESSRRGRWVDYRLAADVERMVGESLPPALDTGGHR